MAAICLLCLPGHSTLRQRPMCLLVGYPPSTGSSRQFSGQAWEPRSRALLGFPLLSRSSSQLQDLICFRDRIF